MSRLTIILVLTLPLVRCKYERLNVVEQEFNMYLKAFQREAVKRSIDIDERLSNISMVFEMSDNEDVAGTCQPSDRRAEIDPVWWHRLEEAQREQLIFHELGHCVLDRVHNDIENECNECLSFMRSSSIDCSINYYSSHWRTYYINELFGVLGSDQGYYQQCGGMYQPNLGKLLLDTDVSNHGIWTTNLNNENGSDLEVEIEYFTWCRSRDNVFLNWNDVRVEFRMPSTFCIYRLVDQEQESVRRSSIVYYCNREVERIAWHLEDDATSILIQRNEDTLIFYLNRRVIHSMDIDPEGEVKLRSCRIKGDMMAQVRINELDS